jgi:hypothetical protein
MSRIAKKPILKQLMRDLYPSEGASYLPRIFLTMECTGRLKQRVDFCAE